MRPNNTDDMRVICPVESNSELPMAVEPLVGESVEIPAAIAMASGISFCSKFPVNKCDQGPCANTITSSPP